MGPEPGVWVRSEEDFKHTLIPLTLVIVLNPPSLTDWCWLSNNAPPFIVIQRAKEVVSDSPGLVDFAIGLVNSVFNLPDGQVMLFEEFEYTVTKRTVKSILLVKKYLGLVQK